MTALSMVVASLGMLSFTAIAHTLPLCGTGFGPCRPGLELGPFAGALAVEGALANPKDGAGAIGHFTAAFEAFEDANSKLADPSLSDDDKCAQASTRTREASRKPSEASFDEVEALGGDPARIQEEVPSA
jgi:hypothetical protein